MRKGRRKSQKRGGQSTASPDPGKVAISRPVGKGEDTAELVRGMGWVPFIFHTVELVPVDGEKIRDQLHSVLNQGSIDWIVFMSSTGVSLLFDNAASETLIYKPLRQASLLAVGPRTRDALVGYGLQNVSIPYRYSSDGVDEFFSRKNIEKMRIVLVRSSSADDSLAESLASRGAVVSILNVYESRLPAHLGPAFDLLNGLSEGRFYAVLFTSAISVSNLFKIAEVELDADRLAHLLNRVRVGAIGPATSEELRRRGIESIVPDEYMIESALSKLLGDHAVVRGQLLVS